MRKYSTGDKVDIFYGFKVHEKFYWKRIPSAKECTVVGEYTMSDTHYYVVEKPNGHRIFVQAKNLVRPGEVDYEQVQ